MNERLWYYLQGSTQQGPVPESQLKRMLAAGNLAPDTQVWSEGMAQWAPADRAEALRAPSPAGGRTWYFLQGNTRTGPVAEAEFQAMIDRGEIGPQTAVWTEGMAEWTPAGRVPGLGPSQVAGQAPVAAAAHAQAQVAAAAQAQVAAPSQATAALAPSEVVFLNGEQFAGEGSLMAGGNFTLLHNGVKVGYQDFAAAMFQAAFLANEAAGAIRLSVRPKKAMLGLKSVNVVWVEPVGGAAWPDGSFEGAMLSLLARGPREAADIIYDIFRVNSTYPHTLTTIVAMTALHSRGLLVTTEQKKLGLFSVTSFHPAPHTAGVVAANPIGPVKELIESCKQTRPDLAQALAESVKSAIGRRKEYDSN